MSQLTPGDFEACHEPLLVLLEDLVTRESPSTDKNSLDEFGMFVADRMRMIGASIQRFPQERHGDHWLGCWGDGAGGILLLVHIDTVYPLGTLASMPWRRDKHHVYGPGCLDMKASLAMALTVIEQLQMNQAMRDDRLSLLCTSDEEIGSLSSRALIEELAVEHDLVLCLEPGLPDGALKTWRKGILGFTLEARGRAAHAGSDIQAGINAIVEMASHIPGLLQLADSQAETSVNPGSITGGTRSNVVPDYCRMEIDVRVKTHGEGERIASALRRLEPELEGASLTVSGGWNRPPMERDDQMISTFERATSIAGQIGISLKEGGTGGGSDANFVARLGVPVLDGLGAIGAGAHSTAERVELGSLPGRCALLASLISAW